ncbi:metallophosphoesterase [Alkalibacillus almallahensis]|uniref:metallophosphoesterase n=1 Tax=Alkalibacillus almallahensis TaxID=1379154 RepID=UPI001420128E|nr:metallophosphoesterase [Alkalibacillus almallahensis]NIK13441.1 serine/threonine protein phosphatase 1 [Alkalibacillus almallahensis]
MPIIYSISDIHGCYEPMIDALRLVDLDSNKNNKLILLGDYVDGGTESCKVLYYVKELEEKYPKQVIILLGNHDKMFIDWYTSITDELQWLSHDVNLLTIKSFFTSEQFEIIEDQPELRKGNYSEISEYLIKEIRSHHSELLNWLSEKNKFSPFYETENQIYVHAGICEEDEVLWKHATKLDEFFWKYPAETGTFFKDIIAGHISSVEVAEDKSYQGRVFWDGQSHYFIDGDTVKSKVVPLLKYNSSTGKYSSYMKKSDGGWKEYQIIKGK